MRLSSFALGIATSVVMTHAQAGSVAIPVVFSESFDNLASLAGAGWVFTNNSATPTQPWFQGNAGVFSAQAGAASSYAAASFLSSGQIAGQISNWMISPQISLSGGETINFFARSETTDFTDGLVLRLSSTGASATASFSLTLLNVAAAPAAWTAYSVLVPNLGGPMMARIAFEYSAASAADANYLGIDSLNIAPIPEPMSAVLLGLGLAGLIVRRRLAA